MGNVRRPALEGTIAVRGDRRLSFAEYGPRQGPAIVWMHGTPGARRQIPLEARELADRKGVRIIGLDRPGIGSSTAHLYLDILDWAHDLALAPLLSVTRVPAGIAITQVIRLVRPLAGPVLDLYAAVQPAGDKNLLARP